MPLALRGAVRVLVSFVTVQDPNNPASMKLMSSMKLMPNVKLMYGEVSSKSFVMATN